MVTCFMPTKVQMVILQPSVEVMATGIYQVSVLPIIEGVGITESIVEHSEIVIVFGSPTTILYTGTCTNAV